MTEVYYFKTCTYCKQLYSYSNVKSKEFHMNPFNCSKPSILKICQKNYGSDNKDIKYWLTD